MVITAPTAMAAMYAQVEELFLDCRIEKREVGVPCVVGEKRASSMFTCSISEGIVCCTR